MGARDVAVGALVFSAIEAYIIITFAPQFRPTGGLGRLGFRLCVANLILYAIYACIIYPKYFSPLRRLPEPKGASLIFGHAREVRFSKPNGERAREWMESTPNDGLIRLRDWFNQDALIPTSNEMFKSILTENTYDYEKQPRVREILASILGDGLILVEGDVHKFQRKHLMPSFQVKVIRELYPVFWSKACELTQMLADQTSEREIELGIWCTRVTLDIIGIAGFGRDFNTLKNPDDEFVRDYNDVLEPDPKKAAFFGLSLIFPASIVRSIPFWEIPRRLNMISDSLYKFGLNLSEERRAELNDPKISKDQKEKRNDILSLLVKSNDFSDHELAHQVLTMMAAGHETTSSTLSWCVYLLALNPELQTQVREEVRAHLPSPNDLATKNITAAEIDALPLLNAVCNETTRLYPTVPVTTRQAVRPTRLGDYMVPKGTSIFIVPWAINRSTALWGKDALEFKPQRWINPDGTPNKTGGATSNYSIMTFLHGPRSCIGQGFARSELVCLLAALVGRYEWKVTRDQSTYYPAGLVTSKPANGMWVSMKEVPGW